MPTAQAKTAVSVTADYTEESTSWGNDDPSVFEMTMVGQLQGEFQITNGYGTEAATPILRVIMLIKTIDLSNFVFIDFRAKSMF